ncbi:hypothetical protein, partial [Roseibium sp. RKSG952]|uniref:hypothetical protein n=1 Tax=Roseibium sp. RKSG952 TaxID=2529384 RepID=UPI001AD94869
MYLPGDGLHHPCGFGFKIRQDTHLDSSCRAAFGDTFSLRSRALKHSLQISQSAECHKELVQLDLEARQTPS